MWGDFHFIIKPLIMQGRWTRLCIYSNCFIYGPRLGALYLLPQETSNEKIFLRTLGLGKFVLQNELQDPARDIIHDLSVLKENREEPACSVFHCWLYSFIHWSRHVLPFPLTLKVMTGIFRFIRRKHPFSSDKIGIILYAIEKKTGLQNCYPRSVITACLCAQNSLPWDVVIGILAPTRMMHAWCSTNGHLPYEPFPEHHMYQPLIIFSKNYYLSKTDSYK
ncbi:MAG: lasso peptide biosynthesis protein [Bacteroidetes bacterium]|nr:lasso peptide biosynthesis protein [Bacteroidota bacterium]